MPTFMIVPYNLDPVAVVNLTERDSIEWKQEPGLSQQITLPILISNSEAVAAVPEFANSTDEKELFTSS